jgi:hypothetical protein
VKLSFLLSLAVVVAAEEEITMQDKVAVVLVV